MGDALASIRIRRDASSASHVLQKPPNGIGVVGLVPEQLLGLGTFNQVWRRLTVVTLTFGHFKINGQPQRVDDQMDFGRQPSPRATYGVGDSPPFAPEACW